VRPDEYVLGVPRAWTAQQQWAPTKTGWRVAAAVSSADLADWIAATAAGMSASMPPVAAAAPPLAEQTFVFSGIGGPGNAKPWVIPAWVVVLAASGATLAAGLAAIERPAFRRLSVMVATAATIGLAAVAAPEVAPLVLQAAVPGVVLAALAWGVRLALARRGAKVAGRAGGWGLPASSLTRPTAAASLLVSPAVDDAPTATEVRPR
jgi:hypothetical protein